MNHLLCHLYLQFCSLSNKIEVALKNLQTPLNTQFAILTVNYLTVLCVSSIKDDVINSFIKESVIVKKE